MERRGGWSFCIGGRSHEVELRFRFLRRSMIALAHSQHRIRPLPFAPEKHFPIRPHQGFGATREQVVCRDGAGGFGDAGVRGRCRDDFRFAGQA